MTSPDLRCSRHVMSSHDPITDFAASSSRLKLHSIAPVMVPPRTPRKNDDTSNHSDHSHSSNRSGVHGHAGRRNRSDSVHNSASIFSDSLKRSSQYGGAGITVPRPIAKKKSQISRQHGHDSIGHIEPIPFDPFSDAACYQYLVQDPTSSPHAQQLRLDPIHLHQFRNWLVSQFPRVVQTLRTLQMLHGRSEPIQPSSNSSARDPTTVPNGDAMHTEKDPDDTSESDEDGEGGVPTDDTRQKRRHLHLQHREAQHQAWRVLFENVRLVSISPGDVFVTQDVTPARDVFFVLSGHCQLLFRPKFLDNLAQKRNDHKSINRTPAELGTAAHQPQTDEAASNPFTQAEAFRAIRRLSLSSLTSDEVAEAMANTVYPMRVLTSGDYFGHEACTFGFAQHIMSAISHGATHRNPIGVATRACLHVLVLPCVALQNMREIIHKSNTLCHSSSPSDVVSSEPQSVLSPRRRAHVARAVGKPVSPLARPRVPDEPLPLPGCRFKDEDVEFLRHTFLFQSVQSKRLEFLATQVRLVHIPKQEYLFTTGQEVAVYLVKSGQLRVCSPEQVKIHTSDQTDEDHRGDDSAVTTVETRHVELEILQLHDSVGLMEASLLQPTFTNYCLATSHDVYVYILPPVALFSVLTHEPTASQHIVENLVRHHSWYKARKFTALNHHNTQTEFRLSLGAQRKSPLPCSRCGWSGHSSTSSLCVRATPLKTAFVQHLAGEFTDDIRPATAAPPVIVAEPSPRQLSRSHRMTQQRLVLAGNQSGSILQPIQDDRGFFTLGPGPRQGSTLLPGLVDFAALARPENFMESEVACPSVPHKRELEKALDRLDAALELRDPLPRDPGVPARPHTQQTRHPSYEQPRPSVLNLRDEALRAVARISTAVAATAYSSSQSPRARRSQLASASVS